MVRTSRGSIVAFFGAVLFVGCAAEAAFADSNGLCSTFALQADRPSITTNPCALDAGDVALETGYYQNASEVGGTQLAAYPEARVRYAALKNTDFFLDAPNEIAVGGPQITHKDAYVDQPGGIGAKETIFETNRVAYAASVEYGPPNPAYSKINARERYAASLDAGLLVSDQLRLTESLSFLDGHRYGTTAPGDLGLEEALSAEYRLDRLTHAGLESEISTGSRRDRARAQSLGGAFVQRSLSQRVLLDTNIGTTFDAVKKTKPHYLGSGLSYRM